MRVLIAIDLQNDFITGSLGVVDNPSDYIVKVSQYLRTFEGEVIFLQDEHDQNYLHTMEGRWLPVLHCQKGTWGQAIHHGIYRPPRSRYLKKSQFVSTELIAYLQQKPDIQEVYYLGLCSDICVISNILAIKAFLPEVHHYFVSHLSRGTNASKHQATKDILDSCQVTVI